jgi:hypothetical protein
MGGIGTFARRVFDGVGQSGARAGLTRIRLEPRTSSGANLIGALELELGRAFSSVARTLLSANCLHPGERCGRPKRETTKPPAEAGGFWGRASGREPVVLNQITAAPADLDWPVAVDFDSRALYHLGPLG